jgi:hypothetical protein
LNHGFAYCRLYSLFASSRDRSIVFWQAPTGRWISEASGHTAVVTNLAINNEYVLLALTTPVSGCYFGAGDKVCTKICFPPASQALPPVMTKLLASNCRRFIHCKIFHRMAVMCMQCCKIVQKMCDGLLT